MERNQRQTAEKPRPAELPTVGRELMQRDFDQASRYLQIGRLAEAEALYRNVLAVEPRHAESLHHLGLTAWKLGRFVEAADFIRRAVDFRPYYAEAWSNFGVVLQALGRTDEAAAACRKAIGLQPHLARAHSNLGNSLQAQGLNDAAIAAYRQAVALDPGFAGAFANLGDALRRQGALEEAAIACRRAIALQPSLAEAHRGLAHVLRQQGRLEEAMAAYRRAIALGPESAACLTELGNALAETGRFDEAIAAHRQALEIAPNRAETLLNLGSAFQAQGYAQQALDAYSAAVAARPDFADAHCTLGTLLASHGRWDEAAAAYRRAIELAPNFAEAHANLAGALRVQGRLVEAIEAYRRAVAFKPELSEILVEICHLRQQVCDWTGLEEAQFAALDKVREGDRRAPPFAVLCLSPSPEDHLRTARRWARSFDAIAQSRPAMGAPAVVPATGGRLRIGYLSSDFNQHATASLIAELFERHDRTRFEIFGYSCGGDEASAMRTRLVAAFDTFADLRASSHVQAAERIRNDGIDILVDLKGYTQNSRPEILALRAAPIQVSYLGYPGTMGSSFIDYLMADRFVLPADQQRFYDEKIVYLPNCYQANDTGRPVAPLRPSRQDCGLPSEGFVFCCFNNSYKITSEMFGVWMRLLRDVPGSVLWLLEANEAVAANLDREATARGIAPQRLIYAPKLPLPEHLARLSLADLFLDTLPVNAHTTASEALWVGLPVLTCAGEAFIGRVAGSLLAAVGLPELIASSLEDYAAAAAFLAQRPALLASLRRRLADNRGKAPPFDIMQTTRNIEAAYLHMAERRAAGQPPAGFDVAELIAARASASA
jgi:predicted O-linked N-acetylglucosamine transferase (SPINDLY family)